MATSETGRILGELKARTGMTWAQLADTIGASSGDYVRKVAAGAKPGRNLDANVSQLWQTGSVERAVPRRRAASGQIARTRAVGESRRRADPRIGASSTRQLYRMGDGRLGWSQRLTAGDPDGIRAAVRSAGRGQHRVGFRIRYGGSGPWITVGGKGGYSARRVLDKLRSAGPDAVRDWFVSQAQHYGGDADTSADRLEVEVIAE